MKEEKQNEPIANEEMKNSLNEKELNEVNGGKKDYARIRYDKQMEKLEHLKY